MLKVHEMFFPLTTHPPTKRECFTLNLMLIIMDGHQYLCQIGVKIQISLNDTDI